MARTARRDQGVVEITTASQSRNEEIEARRRRYLFSMSLRTVCFVAAILTTGWVRYVLIAGALILPYLAVVMANVASPQLPGSGPEAPDLRRPQLPPGS